MPIFTDDMLWLIPIAIWETIWKGIALWKAAHKDKTGWFIALLLLNTAGILPIIYIFIVDKMQPKEKALPKQDIEA